MNLTRQSLLLRARDGDPDAWTDLSNLYRPLIMGWLRRQSVPVNDLEDLTQETLLALVKALPSFTHPGHAGAFRGWLRTIVGNRARDYWRASNRYPAAAGNCDVSDVLSQLEDPESDLSRAWDEEHDRYVLRCLLDVMAQEFEPNTLKAFQRLALDEASGAEVAEELGLSIGAVYVAKSRVLQRIRQEAEGLID